MYPRPKDAAATAVMRGNVRRDTRPELALRKALWRAGLRYYVDWPVRLAGRRIRPDVVFPRRKVAVFLDGCYWHGCELHWKVPQHNTDYWIDKIRRNRERDERTSSELSAAGWTVIRLWEHDDVTDAVKRVSAAVRQV
jgi:DNA mismatch endonuclease, patch repair protein